MRWADRDAVAVVSLAEAAALAAVPAGIQEAEAVLGPEAVLEAEVSSRRAAVHLAQGDRLLGAALRRAQEDLLLEAPLVPEDLDLRRLLRPLRPMDVDPEAVAAAW